MENSKVKTKSLPLKEFNTVVENPTEKLQEQRQLDQNEFVKSLALSEGS